MIRLVVAIGLALALASPAFGQGNEQSARITQSGDSNQRRVIQQGGDNADVSISQIDNGDGSRSEDDCDQGSDAISCGESAFSGRDDGPTPRGGVDSGRGGEAIQSRKPADGSSSLPLTLGEVLLSAAGLGGPHVVLRRRGQGAEQDALAADARLSVSACRRAKDVGSGT